MHFHHRILSRTARTKRARKSSCYGQCFQCVCGPGIQVVKCIYLDSKTTFVSTVFYGLSPDMNSLLIYSAANNHA